MTSGLDAIAASLHLRITPELLYQYVRNGAKGRSGRRLPFVVGSAARLFRREDLDDYDRWLAEPWADPGSPRKDPPQGVRDYLKVESGGTCPLCDSAGPFEDAHIDGWSGSRSNHHHNLLRVCAPCHTRYDGGLIPRAEIESRKREAIERVQAHVGRQRRQVWPIPGAPPLAASFHGRSEELERTVDAMRSGRSIAIEGVGGIGKTQLVLNALRLVATDRPIVWLSVDTGGTRESLRDALAAQARERGIEVRNGFPQLDEARACLVLDGIERLGGDRDEMSDLLEELLAGSFHALIVATTQVRLAALEFDETIALGPLDDAAATAILTGGEANQAIQPLLGFADGHPLTLRLLRTLVRHFGSPAVVEGELARHGVGALADPQRRRQNARTSLSACLELAYLRLGTEERRLLWMVAASPGGFRPGLHGMAGSKVEPAAVAGLLAWHFVELYGDDLFPSDAEPHDVILMLSPIRSFVSSVAAADLTGDWRGVAHAFCQRQMLLSSFIQNGMIRGPAVNTGRALMERELPNALSAFDVAADQAGADQAFLSMVISLAHSTMMTLFTSGGFAMGAEVMKRAANIAAGHGSLIDALQFLYQMQTLCEREHDEAGATTALIEAERIAGDATGEAEAMLLLIRASAAERARDFEGAAALARRSYDLLKDAGIALRDTRRSAGFVLGRALEFGGRPDEALPFYEDALQCAELENDPINRGSTLHHIGNCEAYAGRHQAAMHAYRKAGDQFVELQAVEFISNAIGEAGLIAPHLDPPVGLPGKDAVAAALADIVEQLGLLISAEMFGGRNPRVTMRKLIGVLHLALHHKQERLLAETASDIYRCFVEPLVDGPKPPMWLAVMLIHIQWTVRLFQYLASIGVRTPTRRLSPAELRILARLSANAFMSLDEFVAEPMASYLRRRRGMDEVESATFLSLMRENDADALDELRRMAESEGVDAGWLS